MHYVLFGLDLSHEQFKQLWLLYFNPKPTLDHSSLIRNLLRYVGTASRCLGDSDMRRLPERRAAAIELYLTTPAMHHYGADERLSARELLEAVVTMLGLAGLMGPLGALSHLLSNYKGFIPDGFAWPFGDRGSLRLCVMEAMRLQPAVFGSAFTAPRPFCCQMHGQPVVFPRGTPVHLNFVAGNRVQELWGQNADNFAPQEHAENLWGEGCPYPNFNSWGGRSNGDRNTGRECPGKDLSLTMCIDVVEAVLSDSPSNNNSSNNNNNTTE
ncbi:unnamed protein product [Polarella glacialis]|uniref:Cytochrome P450 n=1 Tax=Polarella glacialis TaxID=89957 RepID=A0A813EPX6_POLGL|nr:unnamed protein product [Polarella glacialis]